MREDGSTRRVSSLDDWLKAANDDASGLHKVEEGLFAYLNRQTESGCRVHGSLARRARRPPQ